MTIKRKKELFGTNGIRGIIGKDMNPILALHIGMAIGSIRPGKVAIGRDTRTSGPSLVAAATSGLLATGCDVIDCGILPIPALQFVVKDNFTAGIMITASHNPREYNGIKVIDSDGTEMGDDESIQIEELIGNSDYILASWEKIGTVIQDTRAMQRYIDAIVQSFPPSIGSGTTVVVDPGCGAAYMTTALLMKSLGCHVITINAQPDGTFPARTPEPNKDSLIPLMELVRKTHASFGIAHDGDADRAVFVDDTGEYVEENKEFALIADAICHNASDAGIIVTPVSTSRLVETIAERHNSSVVYTPVGSIYVARMMRSLRDEGKNVIFGGEGNGGLIYPNHQFCRDGGMSAAMMLFLVVTRQTSLSNLIRSLPPSSMIKKKVHTAKIQILLSSVMEKFSEERQNLIDGIRIDRDDSWALIRPSGTEPFVRIYVEANDESTAYSFWEEIQSTIIDTISDCTIE